MAINGFMFSYLLIFVAAYLPELGISGQTIGLILGAEGLSMGVFAIPFGILSDRKGRKRILVLGSLGAAPMFFVFGLTTNALVLVAAGALGGLFEGTYLATVNAIIADQTTPGNRDSAFTLSFIIGGAGYSLGTALPFFVPGLSRYLGIGSLTIHTDLLILFGCFSLLTPVELYVILRKVPEVVRPGGSLWKGKSTKLMLKFSGINSLIGLGAGFIIPLIPLWLWLKFAVPDVYSGPLLAIANVTIGMGAVFSPRLATKIRNGEGSGVDTGAFPGLHGRPRVRGKHLRGRRLLCHPNSAHEYGFTAAATRT